MSRFVRRVQQAIQFPRGNAAPPSGDWPDATNSGLLTTTTRTMAGASIDEAAWFGANGFNTGTGTYGDPFVIDRVLFTDIVLLGQSDANSFQSQWVKFTNCRFYGNPGNPTPDGSSCIRSRTFGPHFIVEDSTLGPQGGTIPSGGTSSSDGGVQQAIQAYTSFEARRCNIFGANVLIGISTEQSDGTTIIEDNFLHDIWTAAGDHPDIINGNAHASHVVARHNYMDGHRTGDTYVTNGFGIYDQPDDNPPNNPAGIITDWTIDNNYLDRCTTMILVPSSTSRFLNPYVLTDNVFTQNVDPGRRHIGRSPSVQSGNVDQDGNPLSF